jgi:hypothetical protein
MAQEARNELEVGGKMYITKWNNPGIPGTIKRLTSTLILFVSDSDPNTEWRFSIRSRTADKFCEYGTNPMSDFTLVFPNLEVEKSIRRSELKSGLKRLTDHLIVACRQKMTDEQLDIAIAVLTELVAKLPNPPSQ